MALGHKLIEWFQVDHWAEGAILLGDQEEPAKELLWAWHCTDYCMACLSRSFWISSCTYNWCWGLTSGQGGDCWQGVHSSSRQYPWTVCRTHRSAVIACQLRRQCGSLPKRGSDERSGIWGSKIFILSKVHIPLLLLVTVLLLSVELYGRLALKLCSFPFWMLLDLPGPVGSGSTAAGIGFSCRCTEQGRLCPKNYVESCEKCCCFAAGVSLCSPATLDYLL